VRILTVLGTRPEIIRLSRVIPELDALAGDGIEHLVADTGQNYEESLSGLFYDQLDVREPDFRLGVRGESFGARIAGIITGVERLIAEHRPDRLLVLGDTDSGIAAFVAKRMGVEVFHMEAGNRCFDDRVPEEVNRRLIDHSSDLLMPYTANSARNLAEEGISPERTRITGNPIKEVLDHHGERIAASGALDRYGFEPGEYMLLTAHRQENVDHPERLEALIEGVTGAAADSRLPLLCAVHPRTARRLEQAEGSLEGEGIVTTPPLGFFDFVSLEQHARCAITDSGTVQEECCLFGVPAVTIRDSTERPETVECGSNVVCGLEPDRIREAVGAAVRGYPAWEPPAEYLFEDVSGTVADLLEAPSTEWS